MISEIMADTRKGQVTRIAARRNISSKTNQNSNMFARFLASIAYTVPSCPVKKIVPWVASTAGAPATAMRMEEDREVANLVSRAQKPD
jgi:hypothetical protein